MSMRSGCIGWLLLLAFACWGVFTASPTRAQVVILADDFEAPFPNSTPVAPASYVAINNNPNTGNFQIQGGTDPSGTISFAAGIDTNGFPAPTDPPSTHQALFANWDFSPGQIYTYNQYTFYGQPGLATAVPLNQVQVSFDIFVSGHEDDTQPFYVEYQQGSTVSHYDYTVTNNAYKHISFTLDQGILTGTPDLTQPFNFRVGHGVGGFGFDANNVVRLDNVLIQTITPVMVAGDYNGNGIVDAADYTIWRDTLGSTTDLRANGDTTGASATVIDQADYTFWKSHFGATSGAGAGAIAGSAVPEPSCLLLGAIGLVTLIVLRKSVR